MDNLFIDLSVPEAYMQVLVAYMQVFGCQNEQFFYVFYAVWYFVPYPLL